MFTTDYQIDLLEIVISDFTELIPRPKDDPTESPNIDSKADSKKKNVSKKAVVAAGKGSNYTVPESVVNEFGVTPKTMRTLGVSATRAVSATCSKQELANTSTIQYIPNTIWLPHSRSLRLNQRCQNSFKRLQAQIDTTAQVNFYYVEQYSNNNEKS
jgi:hypothetical protein